MSHTACRGANVKPWGSVRRTPIAVYAQKPRIFNGNK